MEKAIEVRYRRRICGGFFKLNAAKIAEYQADFRTYRLIVMNFINVYNKNGQTHYKM